jgi:hypothetical protein
LDAPDSLEYGFAENNFEVGVSIQKYKLAFGKKIFSEIDYTDLFEIYAKMVSTDTKTTRTELESTDCVDVGEKFSENSLCFSQGTLKGGQSSNVFKSVQIHIDFNECISNGATCTD